MARMSKDMGIRPDDIVRVLRTGSPFGYQSDERGARGLHYVVALRDRLVIEDFTSPQGVFKVPFKHILETRVWKYQSDLLSVGPGGWLGSSPQTR